MIELIRVLMFLNVLCSRTNQCLHPERKKNQHIYEAFTPKYITPYHSFLSVFRSSGNDRRKLNKSRFVFMTLLIGKFIWLRKRRMESKA
jgi:hypothetical protein